MLRQVRFPPSSRAEVVCPEVLEVMVTGRVATILAVSATGVSTGTFAGLMQRQGNLESCTRLRLLVIGGDVRM